VVGVHANVLVPVLNVAPEGRLFAEYVRVFPAGSVAVTTKLRAFPAVTDCAGIAVITGALLLALVTVIVAVVLALRVPSVTENVGVYVPVWLVVGVHANVCVPVLNVAPEGRLFAEYVRAFPAESEAVTTKLMAFPAVTDCAGIGAMTGAPMTELATVIEAVVLALRVPSVTENVGVYVPAWLVVGVHANVWVPVLNVAPEGRFVAEYVRDFPAGSVAVTTNVRVLPAVTDCAGIGEITGA
jgi:hypothetical protein